MLFRLCLFSMLVLVSCTRKDAIFTIVETTDTHGQLLEMFDDAKTICDLKDEFGSEMLLLDCGDNFQGTTYNYLSNHDTMNPHLFATHFNYLPYDAIVVGNHDIEAGKNVFDRVYSQINVPVLAANVIDATTDLPYFKPYQIFERSGYRIAVLGMLTPYVTSWVSDRQYKGLYFEQMESSAQKWVDYIQDNEHPDLLIGLFHSGLGKNGSADYDSVLGRENAVKWIATNVSGFDLICYGHDHQAAAQYVINKLNDTVWLMNSGARGHNVAVATVKMSRKSSRKTISAVIIPTETEKSDEKYASLIQPYVDRADAYSQLFVTMLKRDVKSNDALLGPSPWVDAIHRLQFDVTSQNGIAADISFASALSWNKEIEAGPIQVKDLFVWYPFENTMCVLQMTGAEVRKYLEFSYTSFLKENNQIFNFDSAVGIDYSVDATGDSVLVEIKQLSDGRPFDDTAIYNIVMNSYRAMGGGGHLVKGVGWKRSTLNKHVFWESDKDIRSLFVEQLSKNKKWMPETYDNWTLKK